MAFSLRVILAAPFSSAGHARNGFAETASVSPEDGSFGASEYSVLWCGELTRYASYDTSGRRSGKKIMRKRLDARVWASAIDAEDRNAIAARP